MLDMKKDSNLKCYIDKYIGYGQSNVLHVYKKIYLREGLEIIILKEETITMLSKILEVDYQWQLPLDYHNRISRKTLILYRLQMIVYYKIRENLK